MIGTHWEVVGSEEVEDNGELYTYRRFEQLVNCPGQGPHEFRVAWINPDGAESWFGDRLDCEGKGWGCASAPGRPNGAAALLLMASALLVPWRRKTQRR